MKNESLSQIIDYLYDGAITKGYAAVTAGFDENSPAVLNWDPTQWSDDDPHKNADGTPRIGVFISRWDEEVIGISKPTEEEVMALAQDCKLALAKKDAVQAIDDKSRELLLGGLEVKPGTKISTSMAAQINLMSLALKRLLGMEYVPQGFSTVDGDEYVITETRDFDEIAVKWDARKKSVLDDGRQLRKRIVSATTPTEIENIVKGDKRV